MDLFNPPNSEPDVDGAAKVEFGKSEVAVEALGAWVDSGGFSFDFFIFPNNELLGVEDGNNGLVGDSVPAVEASALVFSWGGWLTRPKSELDPVVEPKRDVCGGWAAEVVAGTCGVKEKPGVGAEVGVGEPKVEFPIPELPKTAGFFWPLVSGDVCIASPPREIAPNGFAFIVDCPKPPPLVDCPKSPLDGAVVDGPKDCVVLPKRFGADEGGWDEPKVLPVFKPFFVSLD